MEIVLPTPDTSGRPVGKDRHCTWSLGENRTNVTQSFVVHVNRRRGDGEEGNRGLETPEESDYVKITYV